MRYIMKQNLPSLGASFAIKDEKGRDVFLVSGKILSIGDRLSIRDVSGNEVARIKHKFLSISPAYEVHRNKERWAVVRKGTPTLLFAGFSIEVAGEDELEAVGDFSNYEYTFTRLGSTAARVSKQWIASTDKYGVDVVTDDDALLVLASVIVIDMTCRKESERRLAPLFGYSVR